MFQIFFLSLKKFKQKINKIIYWKKALSPSKYLILFKSFTKIVKKFIHKFFWKSTRLFLIVKLIIFDKKDLVQYHFFNFQRKHFWTIEMREWQIFQYVKWMKIFCGKGIRFFLTGWWKQIVSMKNWSIQGNLTLIPIH